MTAEAKNLLKLLCAAAAIVLSAAALNYTVDPLQLFRPARLFAAMYSADTRLQDAGLIRSQQFDTVFMGTSLAIHYRQSDIDKALGVRSLKLSITGATSKEQSFVLTAALQRHPKRVIWQMDDWIFRQRPRCRRRGPFSRRSLPPQRQRHRELSVQRRHGARVAVDPGAIGPAAAADRGKADERRHVQIPDRRRRRHQCAAARFRRGGLLQREGVAVSVQAHHRSGAQLVSFGRL